MSRRVTHFTDMNRSVHVSGQAYLLARDNVGRIWFCLMLRVRRFDYDFHEDYGPPELVPVCGPFSKTMRKMGGARGGYSPENASMDPFYAAAAPFISLASEAA